MEKNIVELISSLGFPIACVLGCAYFIFNNNKQERIENAKREDKLFGQLDRFSITLEKFNNTLIKVDTKLELLERKVDKIYERGEK